MSWIKSDRIQFISEFERAYGTRLSENDEMLPIMHFIYSAGKSTDDRLGETKQMILKLEESINDSSRITIPAGGELKWQIGIALKAVIIISFLLVIGWSLYFWWHGYNEVNDAHRILVSASPIEQQLLKNVRLDSQGYYFLEFYPAAKTSVKFFHEYELMRDSTVRIYLSKK